MTESEMGRIVVGGEVASLGLLLDLLVESAAELVEKRVGVVSPWLYLHQVRMCCECYVSATQDRPIDHLDSCLIGRIGGLIAEIRRLDSDAERVIAYSDGVIATHHDAAAARAAR